MVTRDIRTRCLRIEPVGSRVTCDPAPKDTDQDYLALTAGDHLERLLLEEGYTLEGSWPADPGHAARNDYEFFSFRSGEVNIIVTRSREFFNAFIAATSVCKRLNLMDKADRIALFQAVLYQNPCEVKS
jgi:hypothetical protein